MLDHPNNNSASNQDVVTAGKDSAPPSSVRLGDFELRKEIGRGGMGTVYEAWQTSLQREIALKVLARHISGTPRAVLRFQREAQAAAKLHHTHIVPIFAQGEVDGNYFYAMELVHGRSINAVIAELRSSQLESATTVNLQETVDLKRTDGSASRSAGGSGGVQVDSPGSSGTMRATRSARIQLDFNEIASHIADVADALDYAHGQGVIHRDIKPHNLLLGDDGRIRVSDFGLARLAEQPGVTVTGELLGSPLYMSSEQIRGNPDDVDARADIYSLGATLYEWLTLQPPYPGETREQVISMILSSEPQTVRSRNTAVPLDLETICMKAIERNRDKRYRTAGEMRDDLRRFLVGRTIVARRASMRERLAKFVVRHPNAAIAAFALLLALLLGLQILQKQKKVETVTAKADEATRRAEETATENETLLNMVAMLQGGPAKMAEAVVGGIAQADPAKMISEQMQSSNNPQTEAVGKPSGIARRAAIDFFVAVNPKDWPPPSREGEDESLADLRNAMTKWSKGEVPAALTDLSRYLDRHASDFSALQLRAILNAQIGQYDSMEKDTASMTALGEHVARAKTWHGLSQLLRMQLNECLDEFAAAIEIDRKFPWPHVLRGLALIQLGRGSEALAEFDTVLVASPKMVPALLGHAIARKSMNFVVAAIPDATEVLQIEPNNADALAIRSECYLAAGELAPAREDIDRAMKIAGHTPGLLLQKAAIKMAEQSEEGAKAKGDGKSTSRQLAPTGTDVDEHKSSGPFLDWWNRHSPPRGAGGPGAGVGLRIHIPSAFKN